MLNMAASETVIRSIGESIKIFSIPFSRFGVLPIGGRSTALKLRDGVFVVVSSPCIEETTSAIDAMGTVKWLLVPDYVHALNISAFHKRYPQAMCIGPEGIDAKKPDVRFEGVLGAGGENKTYGFEDEVELLYCPAHNNKEIALLHKPTRTLVEADLLFNLPCDEQYSKTTKSKTAFWPLSAFGAMRPGTGVHDMMVKGVIKDKE